MRWRLLLLQPSKSFRLIHLSLRCIQIMYRLYLNALIRDNHIRLLKRHLRQLFLLFFHNGRLKVGFLGFLDIHLRNQVIEDFQFPFLRDGLVNLGGPICGSFLELWGWLGFQRQLTHSFWLTVEGLPIRSTVILWISLKQGPLLLFWHQVNVFRSLSFLLHVLYRFQSVRFQTHVLLCMKWLKDEFLLHLCLWYRTLSLLILLVLLDDQINVNSEFPINLEHEIHETLLRNFVNIHPDFS